MDSSSIIEMLYNEEIIHYNTGNALAVNERNPKLKHALIEFATEELRHAKEWHALLDEKRSLESDLKRIGPMRTIVIARRFVGLELAIKLMEHKEKLLESELSKHSTPQIRKVLGSEGEEERIKDSLIRYSNVLGNIRDVVFGMNDGLVEILAATAGLAAAIQNPILVLAAGVIVAISGTLSMAGGAYLSTDYENIIEQKKSQGYIKSSPGKSAAYVGLSYIFGSFFPLVPFILGMSGYGAIALSIILTAVVLVICSTIISIVSDTSATKRAAKTLAITLGIAAITIIIGFYARHYLHISI